MKLKNLSSVILSAMMAATSVPAASLIAPYSNLTAYAIEVEDESTYDNGVVAEGTCGENLKWTVYSQDEVCLVVSGYGEMPDWESFDDTPWAEYCDSVGVIRVECGVQNVSENAFSGIDAFLFVVDNPNCVIPDSETAIPECAEIWGYDESTALAYAEKYGRECDSIGTADEYHVAEGDFNGLEWILWSNGDLAFYGYGDIAAENGVYPWDRVADSIKTITINTSVRSIGENAFTKCTSLESVLMYTPDCKIADSADVFPSDVLLQVGADTTAEEYASKYNLSHDVYNFFTASGEIGDNLSWTLFNGGSLRIYGEGDMIDLGGINPWGEYEDEITRVQINEEVTSIDKSAFEGCDNIAEMIVLNPECKFAESEDAIPEDTVIYAAEGSSALMYAQLFGRSFKTLSSEITAPEEEESYIAYGELGENLTWELLNDGMLYINGEGEMLECGEGGYPWSDYSDMIKEIQLGKEVESIGAYAFYNCTNLNHIQLAPVIGEHAYDGCINAYGVGCYSDIPVNEIGDYAFNNCGFPSYEITNPECVIADSEFVFPAGAIIEGYVGSTAQAHAEKYGLEFVEITSGEQGFIAYGELGENLTWSLYNDGMLYIDGEGEMLECGEGGYPWSEFSDKITAVNFGKGVTSVGAYAFYNCKNITTIDTTKVIGEHAFDGCINVESVGSYMENAMTVVGDYAFNNCGFSLYTFDDPNCVIADSEFVFPDGATIWGHVGSTAQAHAEKYGLDFVEITSGEQEIVAEGMCGENVSWAIYEDEKSLIISGEGEMANWETTDAAPWAEYSDFIEAVCINDGVKSIGENSFDALSNIWQFISYSMDCVIPDSDTAIPENAEILCYNGSTAQAYAEKYGRTCVFMGEIDNDIIVSGELGEGFEWTIYDNGKITINGVGEMPEYEAGNYPWSDYSDMIKNISLAKEVTSIGAYAFYNCTNLIDVGLEDCINIGEHAFEGCENLSYIFIWGNENTIEIGDYAFYGCDALENVFLRGDSFNIADSPNVFPEGVIIEGRCDGAKAYAEKYNIEYDDLSTKAEGNLTDTASWIIYNNNNLNIWGKGIIPDSDGYNPWSEYADDIKNIFINNEIVYIGDYAFYNCKNAETIEYYGVYSTEAHVIGNHAFDGCEKLKEFIAFYEFVEIGDYAFYNCDSMEDIFIYNPECVIADSEFVFPANTVIHGYAGSTAQAYAEKYGLDFAIIEEEPVTTTAPDSDSETTTTTTTTPNDSESELPQTGFAKAYDYLAFSAGVMALCGIYAMKKSKKKEDEE